MQIILAKTFRFWIIKLNEDLVQNTSGNQISTDAGNPDKIIYYQRWSHGQN